MRIILNQLKRSERSFLMKVTFSFGHCESSPAPLDRRRSAPLSWHTPLLGPGKDCQDFLHLISGNSYVQGICTWCALARTRSSTCLDSLFPCPHLQDQILWSFCLILFTFAVRDSAVVPSLSANVVGVLGARHIAPGSTVLLVWVPTEVVRPSPLAHLAVPPVAQVGFGPLLAGGSGLCD